MGFGMWVELWLVGLEDGGIRLIVPVLAFRCLDLACHAPSGAWVHEKPERPTVLPKRSSKHKQGLAKLCLGLPLPMQENWAIKNLLLFDIYLQY